MTRHHHTLLTRHAPLLLRDAAAQAAAAPDPLVAEADHLLRLVQSLPFLLAALQRLGVQP